MFKVIAIACLSTALAACAASDKLTALKPGMTPSEAIQVLGRPDSVEVAASQSAYRYPKRLLTGWAWDEGEYILLFENNRLIKYGTGTIQPREFRMDTQPIVVRWNESSAR